MKEYRLVLASSVGDRDGMALELSRESGEWLAEVFEDEQTGSRSVSFFTNDPIPLPLLEWLLAEASKQL